MKNKMLDETLPYENTGETVENILVRLKPFMQDIVKNPHDCGNIVITVLIENKKIKRIENRWIPFDGSKDHLFS